MGPHAKCQPRGRATRGEKRSITSERAPDRGPIRKSRYQGEVAGSAVPRRSDATHVASNAARVAQHLSVAQRLNRQCLRNRFRTRLAAAATERPHADPEPRGQAGQLPDDVGFVVEPSVAAAPLASEEPRPTRLVPRCCGRDRGAGVMHTAGDEDIVVTVAQGAELVANDRPPGTEVRTSVDVVARSESGFIGCRTLRENPTLGRTAAAAAEPNMSGQVCHTAVQQLDITQLLGPI
mmetsp:Transcript_86659/g.279879  ORF Transcript_86659/g.279879 Transcript_86659/m.279879 type:complete len:236 (-) Transcript_86659:108-815(-)